MAFKIMKCRQSKRQSAKVRYKVLKKIAASKNKKNKEENKLPKKKSLKKKMIQVPNICPFKEEILQDVAAEKQRLEKEKEQLKLKRKAASLQEVAASASKRTEEFQMGKEDGQDDIEEETKSKSKENSLKAFYKEFKKVVDAADVVLEVVDARDPLGTRCQEVANIVKEAPGQKRLVLVLNKSDLVPRSNLDKWCKYLRKFGPVIPFKAATQSQRLKIGRKRYSKSHKFQYKGSPCVGADLLTSLLANYTRNSDLRTSIRVGVVGIPNVGKSSIINSLKRKKACTVSANPGSTTKTREIEIDSKIKLIDSPGIIFKRPDQESPFESFILRNAQRITEVQDPFILADSILRRASVSYFCKLYELPEYHSPEEFLALKAQKMGIFVKGGAPDLRSAARSIIHDWNTGKIKYCTHPPEIDADAHVSAVIISNDDATPEIDPNELEAAQNEIMDRIERRQNYEKEMNVDADPALVEETMEIESAGSVSIKLSRSDNRSMDLLSELKGQGKILECDENDDDDEDEPSSKRKKRQATEDDYDNKKFRKDPIFKLEGNQALNKNKKNQVKKNKKAKTRNEKNITNVADILETFSLGKTSKKASGEDSYDFDTDFAMK